MSDNPHQRRRGDSADDLPVRPEDGHRRWESAQPVYAVSGRRTSVVTGVHQRHDDGCRVIDALIHPRAARRFALTGQVMRRDGTPAGGVPVTLFVDRRPRGETCTDGFGEFDFPEQRRGRVGLRVGEPGARVYVELEIGEL